ncbi:MAG: hypothetical protein FWG18_01215 [Alphaproteobacteria bacterium]|nr:hypothetical protein [Alphaproteobacteria bacterium]
MRDDFALVIFFIPWAILGAKKMRDHTPGVYANIAWLINIAFIVWILVSVFTISSALQKAPQLNTVAIEQIEITETSAE